MLGKTGVSRAENRYFRGKNMKKGTGFLTLFGGAVALYALLAAPVSMRAQETETIEDGVYIGNIYVGGMTEEEAVSAVEAYVESADSAEMTLKTGDKSVSVTAADLGISFSNLNVVDEAIDVGRSGNLIKRYKDKKDLQQGDKVIALSLDVDSDAVASILSEKAAQLNQEAVDNGLVRENGAFKIIKGEQGIEVNVEDSIAAIENYMGRWQRRDRARGGSGGAARQRGRSGADHGYDGKLYDELQGFRSEPLRQHLQCNQQDQWYTALSGRGIFRL